jgi:hypothetical protein
VAWTGAGIRPGRWPASSGARPRGDPTEEAAGESWGAVAWGLCERWSAGREGCASGAGWPAGEKIEWRLDEAARHIVGHIMGRGVIELGYMV